MVTSSVLKKNPSAQVLRNSPVLMVFMPLGHSRRKKSSCPMYVNASPAPTSTNWGMSRNTVSMTPCSEVFWRWRSMSAATAMPRTEKKRPTKTRWSGERPCGLPVRRRATGATRRS
uniref:Uncharacterized protein n=1 Tax=Arundo donax TaxID=35708 RepID=A0A0A9GLG7_ARUDO